MFCCLGDKPCNSALDHFVLIDFGFIEGVPGRTIISDFDFFWTTACITSQKCSSRDCRAVLLLFRVIQNPRGDVMIMDLQLPVQSVHITTKVVSLNPAHGKVYSIQHYVVKVCHWLATGRWFSLDTPVSPTNKTDHYDITEILLKVALNTISLTLNPRWPPYPPILLLIETFFYIFPKTLSYDVTRLERCVPLGLWRNVFVIWSV